MQRGGVCVRVFFPPTVMELSYNVGWDRTAMRYAEKSYERFGESYYAAFAMEIAVSEGMDEETESTPRRWWIAKISMNSV